MTVKTALIAIVAAAALIGAAIVAVPTTAQKTSEPISFDRRVG